MVNSNTHFRSFLNSSVYAGANEWECGVLNEFFAHTLCWCRQMCGAGSMEKEKVERVRDERTAIERKDLEAI